MSHSLRHGHILPRKEYNVYIILFTSTTLTSITVDMPWIFFNLVFAIQVHVIDLKQRNNFTKYIVY